MLGDLRISLLSYDQLVFVGAIHAFPIPFAQTRAASLPGRTQVGVGEQEYEKRGQSPFLIIVSLANAGACQVCSEETG